MVDDQVWVPQYCSVRRHQNRVEKLIGTTTEPAAVVDAIEDFLIQCYSLRDWLTRAGFRGALCYVSDHEHLNVCEGLANTGKHAGLDLKNHVYKYPPYRLYVGQATVLSSTTPPHDSLIEGSGNYYVTSQGDQSVYEVIPFMAACMAEWDEFIVGCEAKIPLCHSLP